MRENLLNCMRKGVAMERDAEVQAIVERVRQLLECQAACFIPGCSERALRHPLLDAWPENSWPIIFSEHPCSTGLCLEPALAQEPIQALCDLATQSGDMQVLHIGGPLLERVRLRSIAALPLERPAGILGVFLLADERARRFAQGEGRLLYAYLSMYGACLETALRETAANTLRSAAGEKQARTSVVPDQFVRSDFVSMVGHELRAPLGVIKGYAGLLQAYGGSDGAPDPALTPDRQRHYLDVIMEQVDLLEVLVNDLLDISRIQRGKLALHLRAVDVGALIRQIVRLAQVWADQREQGKYRMECHLPARLPLIQADAERLQQILLNLIENAVKYSPQGGPIALEADLLENRAAAPGGQGSSTQVRITIHDQGIGIAARDSARLFQPFARLEQSTSAHIPGTGLGLYITRKLLEAMNGSIELQSCEGRGTDVTITLPAIAQRARRI